MPVTPRVNDSTGRLGAALEPLADPGPRHGGLRPSASLALMFGVPSTELIVDIPLGYGFGQRPMAAPDAGKARVSGVIRLYAGRYRLNLGERAVFHTELANATAARMVAELGVDASPLSAALRTSGLPAGAEGFLTKLALLSGSNGTDSLTGILRVEEVPLSQQGNPLTPGTLPLAGTSVGLSYATSSDPVVGPVNARLRAIAGGQAPLLGGSIDFVPGLVPDLAAALELLCAENADAAGCTIAVKAWSAAVTGIMANERDRLLSEKTHWIPYAFGAAPIRSISDPIGQEAHGLIAVVDVVPKD
jgi:manganese oxidase